MGKDVEDLLGLRGLLAKHRLLQLIGELRYEEERHDMVLAASLLQEDIDELQGVDRHSHVLHCACEGRLSLRRITCS